MSASDEIISPADAPTWRSTAQDVVERVAATSVGQYIIRKCDQVLWTIEKTANWSVSPPPPPPPTSKEADTNTTTVVAAPAPSPHKLIRPLPWFLFFPAVILLRVVRMLLCFIAVVMGKEPVTPAMVVYYIQTRRRRLRSIKYYGLRAIRLRSIENNDQSRVEVVFNAIARMFWSLNAVMFERPYEDTQIKVVVKKSSKEKLNTHEPEKNRSHKRRIEDVDKSLTVEELLKQFAEDDDEDGSDFELAEGVEDPETDGSTTTAGNTSEYESDEKSPAVVNGGENLKISSPNGKAQNGGANPPKSPVASNSDGNSFNRQQNIQTELGDIAVSHASIKLSIPTDSRRKVKSPASPKDTPVVEKRSPQTTSYEEPTNNQEPAREEGSDEYQKGVDIDTSNHDKSLKEHQTQHNNVSGVNQQKHHHQQQPQGHRNNRPVKKYGSAGNVDGQQYSRPSSTSSGVSSLSTSSLTSITSATGQPNVVASSSSTESVPTATGQPHTGYYQRRKDHSRGNRKQQQEQNRGKGNYQFNAA